jgi:hypothetical protein
MHYKTVKNQNGKIFMFCFLSFLFLYVFLFFWKIMPAGGIILVSHIREGKIDEFFQQFSLFSAFLLKKNKSKHTHTHARAHTHTHTHMLGTWTNKRGNKTKERDLEIILFLKICSENKVMNNCTCA